VPLYKAGAEPDAVEIDRRRETYFRPYHAALQSEIDRLRGLHENVVLYDCHSIRSVLPRLFEGTLPVFNIGTISGKSCAPELTAAVETACRSDTFSSVVNGRFKGGFITRHFGRPQDGVHALQMELSCRGYMREPEGKSTPQTWPVPYDVDFAAPIRATLTKILETAISWARA
jgi:formiminoglutamase